MKLNFTSGKRELNSFFKFIKSVTSLMDIERFIEHKFEELLDEIKFPKSTLST